MTVGSVQHLTNDAYGFPRGRVRRVKPVALACIHVTGNSKTAAYADLHKAAQGERNYANRDGSDGPSAHDYVARDGWAIEAIDWRRYAAWSNGDVTSPNTANPGIRRVLALRAKGYNANEAYWLEFENVGWGSTYPITAAQKDHVARRIADAARHSGLPINRETVHGHWEINGVDRRNCPVSFASREAFLADVIRRANALLAPPEADMPGLAVRLGVTADTDPYDDLGTARVKGANHYGVRVRDRKAVALADGADLGVVQLGATVGGTLDEQLGQKAAAGDRSSIVAFTHDGELHVALLADVAFTPLPRPAVDTAELELAARRAEWDRISAGAEAKVSLPARP